MASSPVVILLVALGGAREPSTRAMASAAQEALDPDAVVLVREVEGATLASDDRARALADAVHADAIAVLTWPDADHRRAHVHVWSAQPSRWIDRDIDFRNVDAAEDRGKALGFAVASMLPVKHERPAPPPRPSTPAPIPPPTPPSTSTPAAAPAPPRDRRAAFDLVALGSFGVAGTANGFGSEASVRYRVAEPLAIRVGGGLRIGDVTAARASSYVARFDGGLAFTPIVIGQDAPLALGLRADAVLLVQSLSRPTSADATSRGSRVLPGFDAMAEVSWTFVPEAALVLAGGAEVAASATTVIVDVTPVATLPRGRIIGEFGVRVLF